MCGLKNWVVINRAQGEYVWCTHMTLISYRHSPATSFYGVPFSKLVIRSSTYALGYLHSHSFANITPKYHFGLGTTGIVVRDH